MSVKILLTCSQSSLAKFPRITMPYRLLKRIFPLKLTSLEVHLYKRVNENKKNMEISKF